MNGHRCRVTQLHCEDKYFDFAYKVQQFLRLRTSFDKKKRVVRTSELGS